MKRLALFLLVTALVLSCEKEGLIGTFKDHRDGHQYQMVRIGEQVWMAENLAYLPKVGPPSKGSDSDPFYYIFQYFGTSVTEALTDGYYLTTGVLYNYPAAMVACPSGWHLPTDMEWQELEKYLGMSDDAADSLLWRSNGSVGKKLKSVDSWYPADQGDNSSGFNAIPSGYVDPLGRFKDGLSTKFWTSTIIEQDFARFRYLDGYSDGIARMGILLSVGYSVRCLKNE